MAMAMPEVPAKPMLMTPEAPAAKPAPALTGYIETGYQANFMDMRTRDAVPLNPYNPGGHGFVLHSAHLNIDHKFSDAVSAHIGIDAGADAPVNQYNYAPQLRSGQFDVLEAYANYSKSGFTLTAGKFTTYEGIELVPGVLNPTVTHGYLYYYAEPITHTGFKVHYQAGDQVNLGLGIVNGWDNPLDNNNMKTFIGRIGFTPSSSFWAGLSFTVGPEAASNDKDMRESFDLTGAWIASSDFTLNFQGNVGMEAKAGFKNKTGTVGDATWFGLGVQPVYTTGDWSLGGRVEFFDDANGARVFYSASAYNGQYLNLTVAPGYKLGDGFRVRLEGRLDQSLNKDIPLVARGGGKTMISAAVMADYQF